LYARQWCQQPDDALQEAMMSLLCQNPPPDNPPAWLFTTLRHKAMNLARSERRRAQYQQQAAVCRDSWFEDSQDRRIVAEEVEAALAQLPSLQRQIVVTHVWGELTFEQIAEVVEQSASSVHRHYHRALDAMSEMLGEKSRS
jgi:RNA polymerase sigma factor (sigma-70 family)